MTYTAAATLHQTLPIEGLHHSIYHCIKKINTQLDKDSQVITLSDINRIELCHHTLHQVL